MKTRTNKKIHQSTKPGDQRNQKKFKLGLLFRFNLGRSGFHLLPIVLTEENGNKSLGRLSSLPGIERRLIGQLPEDVRPEIDMLRQSPEMVMAQQQEDYAASGMGPRGDWNSYSKECFVSLKRAWNFLSVYPEVYGIRPGVPIKADHVKRIYLSNAVPVPVIRVRREEQFIIVGLSFSINGEEREFQLLSPGCFHFIQLGDQICLLDRFEHVSLVREYNAGFRKFPVKEKEAVLNEVVVPLAAQYEIRWGKELTSAFAEIQPESFVRVAEYLNQYLMLIPCFDYEGLIVEYDDRRSYLKSDGGTDTYFIRNRAFEKEFFEQLRPLHDDFSKQLMKPFFYIPFGKVMKGNWFLKTIRKLQKDDVLVRGFESLKKFRYSGSAPDFELKVNSGTDWFDLEIDIRFGDLKVPLQDIKNAIVSGEKLIALQGDQLGALPDEWCNDFESVLKIGKVKGNTLRLSKTHFTLLQKVVHYIKEKEIITDLEEKKNAFENPGALNLRPVSSDITTQLRPYQLRGFQWMQSLDYYQWGGCLADDMGLGKTLQVIAFLQYVKEKHTKSCSLVVCPTSLIYNWEEEIKKFAPTLRYAIHYGNNRHFKDGYFEENDVVITSYGTVRSDKDVLSLYSFRYIILDESQAIKNPSAQVTQACRMLSGKNRIAMSGTPVQNNTFDLYAQMDFLNPGFLGSMAFFKKEYALPIDKYGDTDALNKLKKMTAPFVLRRTKEKVATDLPDKSEMTLWCEMDGAQREVYEKYKQYYRRKLLKKIDEDGVNRSSFEIIEGLTRLRQICDSPELLKDEEQTTVESTKLRELIREIKENTGDHQVLVFSQFTSMLQLIKSRFEAEEISFSYLDGQTPGKKRMELVDEFQKNRQIKVFLISLKAGGVGLNLTAADYVYLVDPWWNPATESQAIDRTHRIGQTRKVFAYRMICKDTIEEKIMRLQEKKKALSEELITEEKSFVSSLAREDIAFLFE